MTDRQYSEDIPNDEEGLGGGSGNAGAFKVDLGVFAGPVDLLLYLVRKNELDVHDISISDITREYLEYVDLIKMVDLESAGDFIVIASALLKIKSRSLFETVEVENDDSEELSTRDALIRYLMEFEKLGGVADKLAEKEEERLGIFPRAGERGRIVEQLGDTEPEPDYMIFDLLGALKDVLEKAPKISMHNVELMNVTSEMKQAEILGQLAKTGPVNFVEYVTGQPKLIIVVTFIAMLELIKKKKIVVKQSTQFGTIYIYERTDDNITDH